MICKRYIQLITVLLVGCTGLLAQEMPTSDEAPVKKPTGGESLKAWQESEYFGDEYQVEPDTAALDFQNTTLPVYCHTLAAEWLGNLGLPAQSAIFADRRASSFTGDYLFGHVYDFYGYKVESVPFYNTRVPYSNLGFYTGGLSRHGEDRLHGALSVNANKKLNFGFAADYLYGRGSYYNQSANDLAGFFNASYRGERYGLYFIAGLNQYKHYENGGLVNDGDLENMDNSYELKTRLSNAYSGHRSYYFWLNQHYHVGYMQRDTADSDISTFVPVATFGFTTHFEGNRKRYYETSQTAGFYENRYYSDGVTRDTVSHNIWRNRLSVTFNEGFKKWMVFGLRAFVEADLEENMCLVADSAYGYKTQGLLSVGGQWFKQNGPFTYDLLGEVLLLGSDKRLAFNIDGKLSTAIPLGNYALHIDADGHLKSTNPSYFTEHYYSNHFAWNNQFENEWSAKAHGKLSFPNPYCTVAAGFGWQGLKNYIFFNNASLPQQSSNYIQVLDAEAQCNLHLKWFHWDNTARWQYSSQAEELPLPMLSLYSNLYGQWKVFKKVLTIQFGVDCRYNTAYYANAYTPALGIFHTQNEVKVGNYPLTNVYLNLHLKQFRVFVMYYNLSKLFAKTGYFTTPHYPLNPGIIKFGLSWNFYN